MGTYADGKLKRDLSAEKASIQPVHDAYRKDVLKLRDQAVDDFAKAHPNPAKGPEALLAKEKTELLTDFLKEKGEGKLEALSQFNKDHPTAFSTVDNATMKSWQSMNPDLLTSMVFSKQTLNCHASDDFTNMVKLECGTGWHS